MNIREYLTSIINKDIIHGKPYSKRIDIDDGGDNSYIGICVDEHEFNRKKPVLQGVRLFRHTNSPDKLINTWMFQLGDICNAYADFPDVPVEFSSYGKTKEEAEKEAAKYYVQLRKLIKKRTAEYKVESAKTAKEEREELLARLAELDGDNNV